MQLEGSAKTHLEWDSRRAKVHQPQDRPTTSFVWRWSSKESSLLQANAQHPQSCTSGEGEGSKEKIKELFLSPNKRHAKTNLPLDSLACRDRSQKLPSSSGFRRVAKRPLTLNRKLSDSRSWVITCHGSARNIRLLSDWCALLVSALQNGTRNFVLRKESLKDRLALRCLPTKHQCSKGSTFCNPKPAKHAWQQKIENGMFSKFPETRSKNGFLARRGNLSSTWLLMNLDRKTDTITIPLSPPSVCRKNRVAAWSVFVAAQHEESVAGFMAFQFSNSSNRMFKYVRPMQLIFGTRCICLSKHRSSEQLRFDSVAGENNYALHDTGLPIHALHC